MEYKIENCRYYEKLTINEKPIFIFDSHNMALPVWGTFASKIGFLHLLSFDTHTDTHPAFSKLMRDSGATPEWDYKESILNPIVSDVLKKISYQKETFCFEDVYKYSCDIGNTEQILTGVAFGYLSSYTVRCHIAGYECSEYESNDRSLGYCATYIADDDSRKPDLQNPLALDIDLDFFRSESDLDCCFENYIAPYFQRAVVITIAREPRFFDSGKTDKHFTVEKAESLLLKLLKRIPC